MMRRVDTKLAPAAVGTYSQGVVYGGLCYFSGQIGLNPETMSMEESFEGQLRQVLKNVDGLLESEGLKRTDVIKTTIFLTSLQDFGMVNSAYENYFSKPYPARSCVEVSALPRGARVEIEVIAAKK